MILLECKDLSLSLSISSLPLTFGHGENVTVVHYRGLPGESMLAGPPQAEITPGRCCRVAERVQQFTDAPSCFFSKRSSRAWVKG